MACWRLHRCEAIAAITLIPRQLQFISNLRRITFHSGDINGRFSSWSLFIRQNSSRDCGWVNNCSGRIYEPLSNALLMQSRETLTRFCGSFCFEGDNFGDRPRLLTYSTDHVFLELPLYFVIEVRFPDDPLILCFLLYIFYPILFLSLYVKEYRRNTNLSRLVKNQEPFQFFHSTFAQENISWIMNNTKSHLS